MNLCYMVCNFPVVISYHCLNNFEFWSISDFGLRVLNLYLKRTVYVATKYSPPSLFSGTQWTLGCNFNIFSYCGLQSKVRETLFHICAPPSAIPGHHSWLSPRNMLAVVDCQVPESELEVSVPSPGDKLTLERLGWKRLALCFSSTCLFIVVFFQGCLSPVEADLWTSPAAFSFSVKWEGRVKHSPRMRLSRFSRTKMETAFLTFSDAFIGCSGRCRRIPTATWRTYESCEITHVNNNNNNKTAAF